MKYLFENDINNLNNLSFRLTDDTNNELNLNGQDWYLCLEFSITYIPVNFNDSFDNITKPDKFLSFE